MLSGRSNPLGLITKARSSALQECECNSVGGGKVIIVFSMATRYSIRECCTELLSAHSR